MNESLKILIEQNEKKYDYILSRVDQVTDKIDKNQITILTEIKELSKELSEHKTNLARLDVRAGLLGTLTSMIVTLTSYFISKKIGE